MIQANTDIRELIANSGVKYWQVAYKFGKDESSFSKMLRHELDTDKKETLKGIIKDLVKENN